MKQRVNITESELRDMITRAINEQLEESENEGFFNNLRAGFKAGKDGDVNYHAGKNNDMFDQTINNVGQRFGNFKKGFGLQKKFTRMNQLKQELQQLVDDGLLNPEETVDQILNGNFAGFGAAKGKLQNQAKSLMKSKDKVLREAVDRVVNEMLENLNN